MGQSASPWRRDPRGYSDYDETPEPDTWLGGFGKSIKEQLLKSIINNPMTQGAAHPESPGDFAGLLLPSYAPSIMKAIGGPRTFRQAIDKVVKPKSAPEVAFPEQILPPEMIPRGSEDAYNVFHEAEKVKGLSNEADDLLRSEVRNAPSDIHKLSKRAGGTFADQDVLFDPKWEGIPKPLKGLLAKLEMRSAASAPEIWQRSGRVGKAEPSFLGEYYQGTRTRTMPETMYHRRALEDKLSKLPHDLSQPHGSPEYKALQQQKTEIINQIEDLIEREDIPALLKKGQEAVTSGKVDQIKMYTQQLKDLMNKRNKRLGVTERFAPAKEVKGISGATSPSDIANAKHTNRGHISGKFMKKNTPIEPDMFDRGELEPVEESIDYIKQMLDSLKLADEQKKLHGLIPKKGKK